jgi:hypothetical protein
VLAGVLLLPGEAILRRRRQTNRPAKLSEAQFR